MSKKLKRDKDGPSEDTVGEREPARLPEDQSNATATSRLPLIKRVRSEIEAGTYETPERLNVTIQRLWEDLRS